MDPMIIDSIVFPFARILPFIAVFLTVRRVGEVIPSKIRKTLFYAGLSFAAAGVVCGEVMWYVIRIPFEESGAYLVVIEALNLVGAASLYVFANVALRALGRRDYPLSDLAHIAFVFTSLLAVFLAVAPGSDAFFRGLSDLLMSPFSYFLYALSILLIYEMYRKLGMKLSPLALFGSFMMVSSLLFSLLPDFGLFMEGSLSGVDAELTFFMLDLCQTTGCVLSVLPLISLHRDRTAGVSVEGTQGLSLTLYLDILVETYGTGIIGLFRESFSEYERNGVVNLRGPEARTQIERFIVELCNRYGRTPVEIAKGIEGLRSVAESVEFYYLRAA